MENPQADVVRSRGLGGSVLVLRAGMFLSPRWHPKEEEKQR